MRTGPAIALIIVAIVLVAGVFYFADYKNTPIVVAPTATSTTATSTTDYYQNSASWQLYTDAPNDYSIKYPIDFAADETASAKPTTDWRMNGGKDSGYITFTLTVPSAFEPGTNFADAKLTVGESTANGGVKNCLVPDPTSGPATATTTAMINGVVFTMFKSSDAGAGNLYDSTSYRTVHAGQCYAVEYTIHSTQLANYPASYNLAQFDEAKVTDVLDRVVSTFTFQQ